MTPATQTAELLVLAKGSARLTQEWPFTKRSTEHYEGVPISLKGTLIQTQLAPDAAITKLI